MAHSIEPYRPRLFGTSTGVLPAFKVAANDLALIRATSVLRAAVNKVDPNYWQHYSYSWPSFQHCESMLKHCTGHRAALLQFFPAVDHICCALYDQRYPGIDRKIAAKMIGAMLGALGAKADKDAVAGMLDLIESDAIGEATELWSPLHVTPASLALACRTLIATCKFVPKPAELAEARRAASREFKTVERYCAGLRRYIQRSDAVVLEFAPHEVWVEPNRDSKMTPHVRRMLTLHECDGNGDKDFIFWTERDEQDWEEEVATESERNRSFRLALRRARNEFPYTTREELEASGELEPIEQANSAPALAACAQSSPKKTKKLKGGEPRQCLSAHQPAPVPGRAGGIRTSASCAGHRNAVSVNDGAQVSSSSTSRCPSWRS